MDLGKLIICLVLAASGCQHHGREVNTFGIDRGIVEIVTDKNMAMTMNEHFSNLNFPTKYPKFRKVSQMVGDLNLSSNPFSLKTSKSLENFSISHGNDNAYIEGAEEYIDLIWGPNEKIIFEKQRELQSAADKFLTREYLKKMYHFYGVQLPKNFHSKVYLMPMLDGNGFATLLGEDKIFLNVMPCDSATHLGIVVHEYCHLAFHRKNKSKMEKFFKNHPSGMGSIVFAAIDEALAVAIGNRLFRQSIDGIDEECAYAYDYIDNFSKKLKFLVEKYLNFGKEMDEKFFEESIALFCEANPEPLSDLRILMYSIEIFTNRKDLLRLGHMLDVTSASGFLVQEMRLNSLNSVAKKRKTFAPRIYILSNREIYQNFPKEVNCLRVEKSTDGKITIIIRTDDERKIRNAFQYLKNNPIVKQSFSTDL